MGPARQRWLLYSLGALIILAVLGSWAAFGRPGLYARSESPEFCGSCHAVALEYESWFHEGHRRIKCVDCHLPNDHLYRHLLWKTLDGVKDTVAFHTGRFSDFICISDHGAGVVLENCRRCHTELIARINEDRRCWDCHRRLSHRRTGVIETRTP